MLSREQAERVQYKVALLKEGLRGINVDPLKIVQRPEFKIMIKQFGLGDITLRGILELAVALRTLHPELRLDPHLVTEPELTQQMVDEIGKKLETH